MGEIRDAGCRMQDASRGFGATKDSAYKLQVRPEAFNASLVSGEKAVPTKACAA
jgi:hypothetical protein